MTRNKMIFYHHLYGFLRLISIRSITICFFFFTVSCEILVNENVTDHVEYLSLCFQTKIWMLDPLNQNNNTVSIKGKKRHHKYNGNKPTFQVNPFNWFICKYCLWISKKFFDASAILTASLCKTLGSSWREWSGVCRVDLANLGKCKWIQIKSAAIIDLLSFIFT